MKPQGLDWPLQNDLALLDGETCFADRLGDVSSGDRAVKLSAFARLANDNNAQPLQLATDFRRLRLAVQIIRFELGTLALNLSEVLPSRTQSLFLR